MMAMYITIYTVMCIEIYSRKDMGIFHSYVQVCHVMTDTRYTTIILTNQFCDWITKSHVFSTFPIIYIFMVIYIMCNNI